MYNKVKTNIGLNCQLCIVNSSYTHVTVNTVIHVSEDMESGHAVYYDTDYSNDGYIPELKSVGHEWKWAY